MTFKMIRNDEKKTIFSNSNIIKTPFTKTLIDTGIDHQVYIHTPLTIQRDNLNFPKADCKENVDYNLVN